MNKQAQQGKWKIDGQTTQMMCVEMEEEVCCSFLKEKF